MLLRPNLAFAKLEANYNWIIFLQGFFIFCFASLISNSGSISSVIYSVFNWVVVYSFIFGLAYVFQKNLIDPADYSKVLGLTAFASTPLLLKAPLDLLGMDYPAIAGLLVLALILWSFYLIIVAVANSFDIPKRKVMILFVLIPTLLIFASIKVAFSFISEISSLIF